MAYYPATGSDTETEEPGILVYQVEGPTKEQQSDAPTCHEEAVLYWAKKLAGDRARRRFLRALRNRNSLRIVNHRVRAAVLVRRLLDPSPRDERESG